MTPELTYLVMSVVLTIVLVVIAASAATLQVGLPTLAGNRENLPEMTGLAGRAQRAHLCRGAGETVHQQGSRDSPLREKRLMLGFLKHPEWSHVPSGDTSRDGAGSILYNPVTSFGLRPGLERPVGGTGDADLLSPPRPSRAFGGSREQEVGSRE